MFITDLIDLDFEQPFTINGGLSLYRVSSKENTQIIQVKRGTYKDGSDMWYDALGDAYARLICNPALAQPIRTISDRQRAVLKAIVELNYTWLIKDSQGNVLACREKPTKLANSRYWSFSEKDGRFLHLDMAPSMEDLVSFESKEALQARVILHNGFVPVVKNTSKWGVKR